MDDVIQMLTASRLEDGCRLFDHNAEEIGLAVMENAPAILAALTRSTPDARGSTGLVEEERAAFIRLLDATDRFNGVISVQDKLAAPYQGQMILAVRQAYRVLGIGRTEKQEPLREDTQ